MDNGTSKEINFIIRYIVSKFYNEYICVFHFSIINDFVIKLMYREQYSVIKSKKARKSDFIFLLFYQMISFVTGSRDLIYSLIASIGLDFATRQLLKLTVHIVMTKVINRGRIKTFNPMGAL